MAVDESELIGRWVHAFEEDEPGVRVFRRAGTPLPPARGRVTLDVGPGLITQRSSPGADDRPGAAGASKLLLSGQPTSDRNVLRVVDARPDRLVIAKE